MLVAKQSIASRFTEQFAGSRQLYEKARDIFPNGVTHDLRYLEPFPVYIDRAAGAYKWDVDGHRLIDFWAGHGALLFGHSHPPIVEAVQRQMERATHPGACHPLEVEWGEWVRRLIPSAEKVRFVGSGTEATLMALRLARIHTGKPKLLKFAGHFHGWHDFVTLAADAHDTAAVPGVPSSVAAETVVVPPNAPELVEQALASDPHIGCVIIEPTGGHFGAVPVRGEFLRALRDITTRHKRVLIFDEVISGFRVHPGGAQAHYQVTPDLTTMAKILAGGLPGGCLAGRADILAHLEFRSGKPKMKHPGTFNANPLSAAAGVTALKLVATGEPVRRANENGRLLRKKLNSLFAGRQIDWIVYGEFSTFFLLPAYEGPRPTGDEFIPYNGDVNRLDAPRDKRLVHAFRQAMLLNGVDIRGLGGMTMQAHSDEDIDTMVNAVARAVDMLREDELL